ncbi:hypothetical protein PAXRUDRAFT_568702 [Paxillus rubicundulus Ve08.2h10]|uniref:Uncharacterized protein n=1 Tax=Paxillus rubicundulus Ve08.2h10 TaxID=930991 RepID=A0A0D0D6R1_9AGAM|nr:hypothetical protein PAXRUDRAFT_568702 [Paxillus rubicundulus Ve08.2h10]
MSLPEIGVTLLGPLFMGVVGRLILKSSYSKGEALASLCSLGGVVLIVQPPFFLWQFIDEKSDDFAARATPT